MKFGQSLRISWRSITAHKLRSTLTTLGVIIGVAAVITFMVLGTGFSQSVVGEIEAEQQPAVQVTTQTEPEGGVGVMFVDSPIYTQSDVAALEADPDVEYVAPEGSVDVLQATHDDQQVTGVLNAQATTADRFQGQTFLDGEPFTDGTEVVVNDAASGLFDDELGAGEDLELVRGDGETVTVTVTGVVENDFGDQTPPELFLPIDEFYATQVETPDGETEPAYERLQVGAASFEELSATQAAVEDYVETESDAAALTGDDEQIEVQTVEDAIEQFTDIVDQLTLFIGAVAAIALVVGSIGIANIMIVSVTERTREIGVMKAVGARRRDVMQLFLLESVVLGLLGALVGVGLGLGLGYLGTAQFGWPMAYPLDWIAIAVAVGVGVGVAAGLYPAWRGARVDPIEALRRE